MGYVGLRRVVCGAVLVALAQAGWGQVADSRYRVGNVLFADDFRHGLGAWRVEMEKPGTVAAKDGVLEIDVPAGVTVWLRQELDGPVMISYEATAVSADGSNDRVSDLNCFWMASDPASPGICLRGRGRGLWGGTTGCMCILRGWVARGIRLRGFGGTSAIL